MAWLSTCLAPPKTPTGPAMRAMPRLNYMDTTELQKHCRQLMRSEMGRGGAIPAPGVFDRSACMQHLLELADLDDDYAVFAARRTEVLIPSAEGITEELIRRLNEVPHDEG